MKWRQCRFHVTSSCIPHVVSADWKIRKTLLGCPPMALRSHQVSWKSVHYFKNLHEVQPRQHGDLISVLFPFEDERRRYKQVIKSRDCTELNETWKWPCRYPDQYKPEYPSLSPNIRVGKWANFSYGRFRVRILNRRKAPDWLCLQSFRALQKYS